jgi:alpha-1,2-mannosyltransferase
MLSAPKISWPRSARHAKGHAIALAVLMWIFAAVVSFTGAGDRGIAGPLKGADFVQFYTLGHLAADHRLSAMYDMVALHEAQAALVPASGVDLYPPVYPPQIPALFIPVRGWSYQGALFAWTALTIVGYGLIVWSAWRPVAGVLSDRVFVVAAAAAFPPFWSLVLHGQVTVLVLAAFWAGWLALERRRRFLAGVAFGMLAIKPQFGIPLAVVVLTSGEWGMMLGAITAVAAQVAAVWLVLGADVFREYANALPMTFFYADQLEAKPFLSHSIRAVTRLVPNAIGVPVWVALSGGVLWMTMRVWRSAAPVPVRVGAVMLAAVLVNPHLIIYDATVLALPLLWFGAYMQESAPTEDATRFWKTVYWLYAALFAPTAAAIGIQLSVVLMVAVMLIVMREAGRLKATPPYAERAA